ncbi:hypothetical protein Ptr902_01683 [Pyrenophora tritici-repentis]|uniref:Uncharacterized protein n=1 Tax=Pyrenophora tritici-repentis TaxID=45151 RepID=A0A5M9LIC6_9PLEO|nr:hypothetical protein PtrV1_01214 [Pyrenophora tritici-repentis]KAF7577028.1 hypothetical protein PtrM4_012680 [Pyrenophora tritici-repentis]KAI0576851.1 hypothetical protein Alg215_07251 [Pyrenophora tritici-repentis]KAI2487550.1 hypothetical protein Ptr902_01683 [Pyrenophora tritici-repentis]
MAAGSTRVPLSPAPICLRSLASQPAKPGSRCRPQVRQNTLYGSIYPGGFFWYAKHP